jgi:hypothetical protein
MPTVGTHTAVEYEDVLDEIYEIKSKYSNHLLIWAGDINASIFRDPPSSNDKKFRAFLSGNDLEVSVKTPNQPTYYHFTGEVTSTIDYFITLKHQADIIHNIHVDVRNNINSSTHDAIVATLTVTTEEPLKKPVVTQVLRRVKWDKLDLIQYHELVEQKACTLLDTITDDTPTEIIIRRLEDILYSTSIECSPKPRNRNRNPTRFTWTPELIPHMKRSKWAYAQWKDGGKPTEPTHELCLAKKKAKRNLRQAQRRISARERHDTVNKIMEASSSDQQTFHRLIRCQRDQSTLPSTAQIDFSTTGPEDHPNTSDADKWAAYFRELATPKNCEHFDQTYKNSVDLQRLVIRNLATGAQEDVSPVDRKHVERLVSELKRNKAADANGIMSEHIKFSPTVVVDVITLIINRVMQEAKVPESFKSGVITPVHKKDKPQNNPDSYRRITVSSLVGKLWEKELTHRIKKTLEASQSPYQFGFMEGASSNNAVALISEAVAEANDQNKPLYLTLMDASKAFDIVDHSSMLNHLYKQGVEGKIWLLADSMYCGAISKVKWDGSLSENFNELQGIRQGAISSTVLFNNRSSPLLQRLQKSPGSLSIGHIKLGAVMCADDLALLSENRPGMQMLVDEAACDASRERLKFSDTKTIMITINGGRKHAQPRQPISLYGNTVIEDNHGKHLGVIRTSTDKNTETVDSRIQLTRRTAYALMGAPEHLRPSKAYLRPGSSNPIINRV